MSSQDLEAQCSYLRPLRATTSPQEPPSSRHTDAHMSLQQHRALGTLQEAHSGFSAAIPSHMFNLLDERIQPSLSASPHGPQHPAGVPTSHFLQQPGGQEFTR